MKNIENKTLDSAKTTEEKLGFFENKCEVLEQEIEELQTKLNWYEEQHRLSMVKKYGSSSEKTNPDQMSIFNEAEKLSMQPAEEPIAEEIIYKRKKRKSKSKKSFDDLPVEEIYYTLAKEDQICKVCNGPLHEMKTEVRKELKIVPAQVKVVHHIKQVYACRECDINGTKGTIVTAPMPKPVLPGSMVSPSLLAFIMEKKYNQALPLYRQEKSFVNFGIDISRQNMAKWIIHGADVHLKTLYDRLHVYLMDEDIIHADETVLNVLDEKQNSTNYMWLYASAKTGKHPIYLYEYQPSRANKHPKNFLEEYSGYLQSDGYPGYNSVSDVIQIGCLAHAQRKFDEAIKALPEDAIKTRTKAHEGLLFCKKLYHLENTFSKLSPSERYLARIEKTKPILEEFHLWLIAQKNKTLPKSKLGQAINYNLKQWPKLTAFLLDGHIAVDNNLAERAIKPFVIGRKNWMFSKSPKGARASGVCYSIIETAKANSLRPFQYLEYLFEKLPNIDLENMDELDALLPWSETIPTETKLKKQDEE